MHHRFLVLISAFTTAMLLAALPSTAEEFKRISTEQDYQKLVVGKRWYLGDGYVTSKRNGKLTG